MSPTQAPRGGDAPQAAGSGLIIAKLYYLIFFAAIGAIAPFFNVFLENQGLTGRQIGWLGSIPPLLALVANPFWGMLSDRWQIHRAVLVLCSLVAGLVTPLFLTVRGFGPLMALVVVLFFFRTPVVAILDGAVMTLVERTGATYGRQRLWGSLGFVVASYGTGLLVTSANLDLVFWFHGLLLAVGCSILGLLLPMQRTVERVNVLGGLRVLLAQRSYVAFLLALVFLGVAYGSFFSFLGLHILALGGDEAQIGLAYAANAVMEVPIMFLGARWLIRYRDVRLIQFSLLGFVLVWIGLTFAATPLQILAMAPGIGACYAIFWMATVAYASRTTPAGMTATAQALVGAAQHGLGWSLGAVIGGYLWDWAGGQVVLMGGVVFALVAALTFWWGNRLRPHRRAQAA